jgi:hypothetical protein
MMEAIDSLPEDSDSVLDTLRKLESIFDPKTMCIGYAAAELTLSPYCNDILDFISEHKWKTELATNASIYNPKISQLMKAGIMDLLVSIDAGTRETFKQVRGVDLFDKVVANLKRYAKESGKRIKLQYIIVEGVNDNKTDLDEFISLVYDLDGVFHVTADALELLTKDMLDSKIAAYEYLIKQASRITEVNYANWKNQMMRLELEDVRYVGDVGLSRVHYRIDRENKELHKRIDTENKELNDRLSGLDWHLNDCLVEVHKRIGDNVNSLSEQINIVGESVVKTNSRIDGAILDDRLRNERIDEIDNHINIGLDEVKRQIKLVDSEFRYLVSIKSIIKRLFRLGK